LFLFKTYFMAFIKNSCDTDRRGLGAIQNLKILGESFRIPVYEMLTGSPDRLSSHNNYSYKENGMNSISQTRRDFLRILGVGAIRNDERSI